MKATGKTTTEEITATLEYALSQPPSKAGLKLRSDRELADVLQVNPSRVRASLLSLVRKGVLVRQHGSGTYVRRLASLPRVLDQGGGGLTPEKLFKNLEIDESGGGVKSQAQTQFHLGLWGDLQFTSLASQQIYGSIVSSVGTQGHRVTLYSILQSYKTPFSVDEMARQIEQSDCDGFIVLGAWGRRFQQALAGRHVPVVYFASGSIPVEVQPMIFFNTHETTERGIQFMTEAGYERVGLLGYAHLSKQLQRPEQALYELGMSRAGLGYRAVGLAEEASVASAVSAVRSLLDRREPPEAIYVSDDTLMSGVVSVLSDRKLVPGRDIGVVTLSNYGMALPSGYEWTRLEFNAEIMAKMIMDRLLEELLTGQGVPNSVSIHAEWIPGQTLGKA